MKRQLLVIIFCFFYISAMLVNELSTPSTIVVQIKIKGQKCVDIVEFYGSSSEKGCTAFEDLDSVLGEKHERQKDHVQHT